VIERLLPSSVVCVERRGEPRSKNFEVGRTCVREALQRLGSRTVDVPSGSSGEPLWPEGVVGSVTHTEGYCAAAVAWARDVGKLGIDAEVHRALSEGALDIVANPDELKMIRALPAGIHWDAVLFSAKESIYKAWFPSGGPLGWEQVSVVFYPNTASFTTSEPIGLTGRFLVTDSLVLTVATE
jgi:4'-phosphopantetheinyl transferase EntD